MENLTNEFGEMGVLGNLRDNLPVGYFVHSK